MLKVYILARTTPSSPQSLSFNDVAVAMKTVGAKGPYRPLSHNAETKDFARPTSHPVRGWTGKNKAFCSPGTQNGRRVIKVYCVMKG